MPLLEDLDGGFVRAAEPTLYGRSEDWLDRATAEQRQGRPELDRIKAPENSIGCGIIQVLERGYAF